jgi:hypothetical protein
MISPSESLSAFFFFGFETVLDFVATRVFLTSFLPPAAPRSI